MTYNLQNIIFNKMPVINQTEALGIFTQMDEILEYCICRLYGLKSTVYCLVDISTEIGSSLTHGRLIFNRPPTDDDKLDEKPKEKHDKNYGSSAKLEDLLTYDNDPDIDAIKFLCKIMKVYNCWTTGKVDINDFFDLNLCRATYEYIVQDFIELTKDYVSLCSQESRLRELLYDIADVESASKLGEGIRQIQELRFRIESVIGCSHNKLFSLCQEINHEMKRYKYLKERIYKSYLRIVYKAAKEKARAEQQVLENFQNGSIGLLRAISTYNSNRGVFSSYAKTWTNQHILLKLKEEANAIRLPISMWQTNNDLDSIQNRLVSSSDNSPLDPEVLAEASGLGTDRVLKVFEYFNSSHVVSMENQNSIDASNSEGKREESYDPYEPMPFIDAHIDLLTPRQSFILFLTYGMYERLPGQVPEDPQQISKEKLRQKLAKKLYFDV